MLQALHDEVIVKPIYEKIKNNIILPEKITRISKKDSGHTQYELYHGFIYGEVVSVGKDYKETYDRKHLVIGNNIIWIRHEGKRFFYDNQEYIKLKSEHILAKIEL